MVESSYPTLDMGNMRKRSYLAIAILVGLISYALYLGIKESFNRPSFICLGLTNGGKNLGVIGKMGNFTKKIERKIKGMSSHLHPDSATNSTATTDSREGELTDRFKDQMAYFEANADE